MEYNKLMLVTLALEHSDPISEDDIVSRVHSIVQFMEERMVVPVNDFETEYFETNGLLEVGQLGEFSDLKSLCSCQDQFASGQDARVWTWSAISFARRVTTLP